MLDLLLLEATLDDQTPRTVHRASGTHLSEHVLDNVLRLPVHTFADIGDVGKDGLLVAITQKLWRRDRVPLANGGEEGGVGCMELGVEAVEEL